MKIYDIEENLLAILIRSKDIVDGKNFITDNSNEFQLASFSLGENEVIERHHHPQQSRSILNTSEVLVLLEGQMQIEIYDKKLELVEEIILNTGDTIGFFGGGHGITLTRKCKFIEVKQGPFDELNDKKRF